MLQGWRNGRGEKYCSSVRASRHSNFPSETCQEFRTKTTLIKYHFTFLLQAQLVATLFRNVKATIPSLLYLRRKDEVGIMQAQHDSLRHCHILLRATTV